MDCFVCSEPCKNSNFILVGLETAKYKTKYTVLIGNLINSDYEIIIKSSDLICTQCYVLLENYDQIANETKTIKSVLSRQIAQTYGIESDEEVVYLDKSKTFVEIPDHNTNARTFKCIHCDFSTVSLESVHSHVLYHQIIAKNTEVQQAKSTVLNPKKFQVQKPREKQKSDEKFMEIVKDFFPTTEEEVREEILEEVERVIPKYDEQSLKTLIDLDLLEDEFYDSNLKNRKCISCVETFNYASDYVRHLRIKHKCTITNIYGTLKGIIKKPNKVGKLMCPFCFTNTSSPQALEIHVRQHELGPKTNIFNDRISGFIKSLMSSAKCYSCDADMVNPVKLDCEHEAAIMNVSAMTCDNCSAVFYNQKLYNNHLGYVHFCCFICNGVCRDRHNLCEHLKTHLLNNEYKCNFCTDVYKSKTNLTEHMKLRHSSQCCTYCCEYFLKKNDLVHHIRFAHSIKRDLKDKPAICDLCGISFKNRQLYTMHCDSMHLVTTKGFSCTLCSEKFTYRYLLFKHMQEKHKRKIVDASNFYKCFLCNQQFSCQQRSIFLKHLDEHSGGSSYCQDCNVEMESENLLEVHRERSHQDFSVIANKQYQDKKPTSFGNSRRNTGNKDHIPMTPMYPHSEISLNSPENDESSDIKVQMMEQRELLNAKNDEEDPAPAILKNLNMNNLILTEDGQILIQNFEGFDGQESLDQNSQIHINLEQFLLDQGLAPGTEISFVQGAPEDEQTEIEEDEDAGLNQNSQNSLLQTYKEIFEPDEYVTTSEIETTEDHMNGEYITTNNGTTIHEVVVDNSEDQNQSTLDELGDILLEVAAAAECKTTKPNIVICDQTIINPSNSPLWGKKRNIESLECKPSKKRSSTRDLFSESTGASNFSQAYELFVKGMGDKKTKDRP